MKAIKFFTRILAISMLALGLPLVASANIWIDETFEDGPFTQGNGDELAPTPSSELDIYSSNALANTITASPLATTGSVVSSKAFEGGSSYQLDPGDVLSVGSNYQDPGNGNYVIFQFAVNVDPIPVAGEVGRFRINWDTDTGAGANPDHSFYVKLQSNGTTVDIVSGEDIANGVPPETTIGTLADANDWEYVTVIIQNHTAAATYTHAKLPGGSLNLNPGAHFYSTSITPEATINFANVNSTKAGTGLGFAVTSGVVYIDDIYWEGGMDAETEVDALALVNIRPFDKDGPPPSSVNNWSLY